MITTLNERESESHYVEAVSHGFTISEGSALRPAESRCHLVLVRHSGTTQAIFVGPMTSAGMAVWGEGAEIFWIRLRLGTFMPHLPTREFLDAETMLPNAASRNHFWLKSATWQFPDYEDVECFVERLAREEVLVRDPLVSAVLQEQPHDLSPRTIRHRFLQATGLTQNHIRQVERAQQAAMLLRQGVSILDTVEAAGYFDQPHMTRSLKQWIGSTPAQLALAARACQPIQAESLWPDYNATGVAQSR